MRTLQVGRAALALALAAAPVQAGVLLVCNGSAGCPGGFSADDTTRFATIAAATSAASSDDTILIWPGTYKEEILLTKGDLTIRGMDRYGVILDGDIDGDGNFNPDGTFDSDNLGVALQAGNASGSVQAPNVVMENDRYGIGLVTFFVPPQHNMVFSNTLWSNGTDLVDGGPGSFANCFSDNVNRANGIGPDAEPSSDPPSIQTLNSCRSEIDPVAVQVAQNPVVAAQIVANGAVQILTHETIAPQPAPATPLSPRTDTGLEKAAVSCMNPCADLPDNDFCSGGSPVAGAQSAECAASI